MEVQEIDDEVDQVMETKTYKNYYWFMADNDKEHSPLHYEVVEKLHFMLRDNHLTVEPFLPDTNHIFEIIKECVVNVEYQVNDYKDEQIATQFMLEELICCVAK